MNWNKQGWVGLPLFSPVAACSIAAAAVPIFLSSAPLPLALKGMSACMSEIRGVCVCVCLDVFVLEAEEAEGGGVMRTSTLFVCVCALCVKWRQGGNGGTRLYNGVRTPPASSSLCLPLHYKHTHTHTLTRSFVRSFLAHGPNQTSCNLSFGCRLGRQRRVTFSFWLDGNPSL